MTLSKLLENFAFIFLSYIVIKIYSTSKNNLLPPLRTRTFTIALLPKLGEKNSFCKLEWVDPVSGLYSMLKKVKPGKNLVSVGLTGSFAREFGELRTSSPSRFFLLTLCCGVIAPQTLPSKGWHMARPAMPFSSPCHAPSAQGWQSPQRKRSYFCHTIMHQKNLVLSWYLKVSSTCQFAAHKC